MIKPPMPEAFSIRKYASGEIMQVSIRATLYLTLPLFYLPALDSFTFTSKGQWSHHHKQGGNESLTLHYY